MKIETRKYLVLTEHEQIILEKALVAAAEVNDALFHLHRSTAEGQKSAAVQMERDFGSKETVARTSAKEFPPTAWDRTRLRKTIQKLQAKAVVLQHCADDLLANLKDTR